MEAIFNSPLLAAQARVDFPPKPPDPTRGHTRDSHEHCIHEGEVNTEHTSGRTSKGGGNLIASLQDKATKGTVQGMGQNESDSDPLKARIGRKPKEKQEHAPQAPDHLTPGADFRSHPSSKPPHLEKEVRSSTESD